MKLPNYAQRLRGIDVKALKALRLPQIKMPRIVSLQTKLTIPYMLLTLILAMVGTYIVTRLVSSSVRERFDNQLLEASRVAADGIVQREKTHLAYLRMLTFTTGIAPAVANRDADSSKDLLWPLILNNRIEALGIMDLDGKEILTMVQDPRGTQYVNSKSGDFSQSPIVRNILTGKIDTFGDKYAEVLPTAYGPYLFTSASVRDISGQINGVLLVGTRIETLLASIKTQALADVVILDPRGKILEATIRQASDEYKTIELSPQQITQVKPTLARDLELFGRRYKALYSPLVVRQQPIGILVVLLSSDFVFDTSATSRDTFIVIFICGTIGIIGLGYLLARNISQPLLKLRAVSQAVAQGDLKRKTNLNRLDEIGDLAKAFDTMTIRLRQRTAEAARLYAETAQRNGELAQINAKFQEAQQQLVQSEKLAGIGQLTAGIIHDVKNPLAVVIGMLEEILHDKNLSQAEAYEYLKTVHDNAWRASNIITDLLKFARQSTPEAKTQDIAATTATALRLTEYLARRANIKIIQDLPANPVRATYDATQIEQVLINLIQNAIQSMPQGGQLRVALVEKRGVIAIAVQDTGTGIPEKNLLKIFDPFFTTKPPGEGTGLGLSVSYGIISRHGGRIEVTSKVGQGTTFTILLPVQPPPALTGKEN